MLISNYSQYTSALNNPMHTRLSIKGTQTQLSLLSDYLSPAKMYKNNRKLYREPNKEAISTLILLTKTYQLYKDKINVEHPAELLKFALNNLETGLFDGIPYINEIDKDFIIIEEIFCYIDEIRSNYYAGTNYPIEEFSSFFSNRKNMNTELYKLFNSNVIQDTILYKAIKDEDTILENMLDDYTRYRDTIFYRLENLDFYIDTYLNDPLTKIELSTLTDTGLDAIYSNKYNIKEIVLYSHSSLLELAINVSYQIPECEVEIEYINADMVLKHYKFKNGELINGAPTQKEIMFMIIRRAKLLNYTFNIYNGKNLLDIALTNIHKFKVANTCYVPICINSKVTKVSDVIDYILEDKLLNFPMNSLFSPYSCLIKDFEEFKNNYTHNSTILYLYLLHISTRYSLHFDTKVDILVNKNGNRKKIFKNKVNGKAVDINTCYKKIFKNK